MEVQVQVEVMRIERRETTIPMGKGNDATRGDGGTTPTETLRLLADMVTD